MKKAARLQLVNLSYIQTDRFSSGMALRCLPTYCEPMDEADETVYPFILCSGGRLPNAIHSRLHKVPWVRSLRPDPMADISIEDAQALGLKEGTI